MCSLRRFRIAPILFLSAAAALVSAQEEDQVTRSWTDLRGRETDAVLLAFDGVRATFLLDGGKVAFVPFLQLSEKDRDFLSAWRDEHPGLPWIDPVHMPPWPPGVDTGKARVVRHTELAHAETPIVYRSRHFELQSDLDVATAVWEEIATVLEATRELVYALPLGLRAKPALPDHFRWIDAGARLEYDPDHLYVQFFSDPDAFARTGVPAGAGGFYANWRRQMVISLDNFGIKNEDGRLRLDYRENLFVLKHEITHQLMHYWLPFLPQWLSEGFAEYIAAVPYRDGRYSFQNLDSAFLKYLNRWRYNQNPRSIPAWRPQAMLEMTPQQWIDAAGEGTPIRNYNSAALLVYHFLHVDGDANGAGMAACFDALRRNPLEAEKAVGDHLLRGRAPGAIGLDLLNYWREQGVEIRFE